MSPAAAAGPADAEPAADRDALSPRDLHGSLSDPILDTMNFLNEVTARYPDAISFAPGRPYDGFFDTGQIITHLRRYLDHLERTGLSPEGVRDALFQYGPTAGRIRELIADALRADEGIDVPAAAIVVTVGCQEAMLLAVRALIRDSRDVLLVSSPCYVGITGAARLLDVEVGPVEEDEDGPSVPRLERAVREQLARGRRPRAFYVVPDHSNPSGRTMPLPARRELLAAARRLGLLILEDSPYRLVSRGEQLPTLKALDRHGTVVHLGSMSKTLFPGVRVGYAVADQPVRAEDGTTTLLAAELTKIKSMVTVNTSALSQAVVAGMLLGAGGRAREAAAESAEFYGASMDAVLRHLDDAFPEADRRALGVSWNRPSGGFFLTLAVPFAADTAALTRSAREHGVIWTPMAYFHPGAGGERAIRLSVSYLSPRDIAEGTARLARFVKAESALC